MRFSLPTFAAVVAIAQVTGGMAVAAGDTSTPKPTSVLVHPTAADSDAVKHAQRTACIEQAKLKKRVGAQKNAFIKTCINAH